MMAAFSAAEPPRSDVRIAGLDAEIARIELPLAHVAVDDLDHEARAERRELVEASVAVHDEGAPGAQLGERLGVGRRELRRVDAEDAVARTRGVRERPEHVEDGADADLLRGRARRSASRGDGRGRT